MTQLVVRSKQSAYHPDFQWEFFATWVMEMFDTWGLTHDIVCPQFCPCFSFRLLAFPVSALVSPSSASQIPNTFTPWTPRNAAECTVNPVLLCHIKPTAHMHILCVCWKCRVWCLFKICSWIQHLPAQVHIFFHGQFLIAVYFPSAAILLSTGETVFNTAVSILDPHGGQCVVWSGLYLCCKLSSCDGIGLQENKLPFLQRDRQ